MAGVLDVASYILRKTGPISTWQLQKLTYYGQAWRATWRGEALFDEKIEAWANGPVCPILYNAHKGQFSVSELPYGDSNKLTPEQAKDIDRVVDFYSKYNGQQLSDITHAERPWQIAREGLSPSQRGNSEITLESMVEYYGSLKA